MSKITLGTLFILAGLLYGSLSVDAIYDATLGYLVENKWIVPPAPDKVNKNILGRKPQIILTGFVLILIGLYLLWNHNI